MPSTAMQYFSPRVAMAAVPCVLMPASQPGGLGGPASPVAPAGPVLPVTPVGRSFRGDEAQQARKE